MNLERSINIFLLLGIGFLIGRCHRPNEIITTIERVDTVVVEKPMPYKVEVVRKVSVPVYVPTPADTVVIARVDSVLVEVPVEVERREYRDSMYRAIVSGAKIGDLRPTLESMEVYSKSESIVVKQKEPLLQPYISGIGGKNVVGVGGGVFIKSHHGVGADYLNVEGKSRWAVRYTYKF